MLVSCSLCTWTMLQKNKKYPQLVVKQLFHRENIEKCGFSLILLWYNIDVSNIKHYYRQRMMLLVGTHHNMADDIIDGKQNHNLCIQFQPSELETLTPNQTGNLRALCVIF